MGTLHAFDTSQSLSSIPYALQTALNIHKSANYDQEQMILSQQNTMVWLAIASTALTIGIYLRILPMLIRHRKYHMCCGSQTLKQKLRLLKWIEDKFGNIERVHAVISAP